MYNVKAAEVGKPLNVFKSEKEHLADLEAKIANLARAEEEEEEEEEDEKEAGPPIHTTRFCST